MSNTTLSSSYNQTIIAQCTPSGSGALALLRLSGDTAVMIADQLAQLVSGKKLCSQPTHTIHYGSVIDRGGICIDRVLFLLMYAPHTFTGDDTVEITCHNNPFIIQAIIEQALLCGARLAYNGEFSKRAVLNGKIDVIQAEAINEIVHANTQLALKHSLSQLQGSFSHWISTLEKDLIKALALSESSFEFLDEENMEFNTQIKQNIERCIGIITHLKKTFDQQQQIRQGIRIAIIGLVNVGKSSLFNALLAQERAIVTNIAGTTRDVIEAGMYKNGNYWTLIDTAGLRYTKDIIEHMGIERSYQEAEKADIVLLVFDGSEEMNHVEQHVYHDLYQKYAQKVIVIKNKIDKACFSSVNSITCTENIISISNQQQETINNLEFIIQEKIVQLFNAIQSPFILNKRQFNCLIVLEKQLMEILPLLTEKIVAYELVSYHLTDALTSISELTGKTISQAGMDAVFQEFCVGK